MSARIAGRMVIGLAVAAFGWGAAPDLLAQEAKEPAPAAPMMPATPGPEHERLGFLVGTWDVCETSFPSPYGPGGTAVGTVTNRWGLGGLFVIMDYQSKGPMGEYQGHGLLTYDPEMKVYKMWWFDVMGASHVGEVVKGDWEGQDLVFRGEDSHHGEAQAYELRFGVITEKSHTLRMSGGPKGQPMKLQMEVAYTKR